jgi:hypothetical protein
VSSEHTPHKISHHTPHIAHATKPARTLYKAHCNNKNDFIDPRKEKKEAVFKKSRKKGLAREWMIRWIRACENMRAHVWA